MGEMDAVLEPELEVADEVVEEHLEEGGETPETAEVDQEKVDGRKGSKEFRDALKVWEQTPEGQKFAKQARANHFKIEQIAEMEPSGIQGVRDKYALLESVGGAEAITQLQERVASADATDAMLASGDPKALEALGADFDPGLAKLTPTILDRVMKADPQAYASAILPHLMANLASSPMVGDLNGIVDALNAPHLDDAGKLKAITGQLNRIAGWFAENEKKAGDLKTVPTDQGRAKLDQERSEFEKQQQAAHWESKIAPQVNTHERSKLEEFFKPYDTRLKLDTAAKTDLFATFRDKMKAAANADPAYLKQMQIYRNQKNPDPTVVANYVKNAINKHAKAIVETAVKARYGRFLSGGTKPVATVPGARTTTSGTPAVTIVSVKPATEDIDYRATSEQDQWKGLYTLKSGKKVQVRKGQ